MPLLSLRAVSLAFGGPPVLDRVDLRIHAGERLCLLGRNGEGKSTLLHLIAGDHDADEGEIQRRQGLRVASLVQDVREALPGTVYEVVAAGVGEQGAMLARYHHISEQLGTARPGQEALLSELARLQELLDSHGGWQLGQRVEQVLSRLQLSAKASFQELSGGFRRRVLLARALVSEPDLLLLDEPTNHLDLEAILWLETFLLAFPGTLLFITHDRMLLQKLATRIIELDRGRLTSWPGDYQNYLRRKQEALQAEAAAQDRFDKKLAQEESWIRQGIKARRTRNEGRVRALQQMRKLRQARRVTGGKARLQFNEALAPGKLVVEAVDVSCGYGEQRIIDHFSTLILRGDKVGIMGPNGAGKTTLLNLLLGRIKPVAGQLRLGTGLEVAYFDQYRAQLNEEKSIIDNVADGSDRVIINGKERHVISYLQDFLFAPARLRTPVRALSGGERNRLLLARLFTRPANLLVMDEPTNDLDMETLELLEALLVQFQGTLLLVSHDRAFINQVVTSTLVLEGKGRVAEYVGGYDDYLRQARQAVPSAEDGGGIKVPRPRGRSTQPSRLGYRQQRELDALPQQIEALELAQQQLHEAMAGTDYFHRSATAIASDKQRLEVLDEALSAAYDRWEALETLRQQTGR